MVVLGPFQLNYSIVHRIH